MGYSGYTEYLCETGHYFVIDCWDEPAAKCKTCSKKIKFCRGVDTTNGVDLDLECTYPAKREEIGFEDIWKTDHYNNRYATKRILYKPSDKSLWRKQK